MTRYNKPEKKARVTSPLPALSRPFNQKSHPKGKPMQNWQYAAMRALAQLNNQAARAELNPNEQAVLELLQSERQAIERREAEEAQA